MKNGRNLEFPKSNPHIFKMDSLKNISPDNLYGFSLIYLYEEILFLKVELYNWINKRLEIQDEKITPHKIFFDKEKNH